jgi:16S rRNA (cytosine967-C5)-methyltransferase
MLYATCSLLKQENSEPVAAFLERQFDAHEIRPLQGEVLETVSNSAGPGYQLLPGAADTDGFYYALIERHA